MDAMDDMDTMEDLPGPTNPDVPRTDLFTKEELIDLFGPANYVVFALMLLVSAAIGVFFMWRGQKNTEEMLMASKSMGTFPMTLSLVASFMSAITLLGTPAEMYVSGTQYCALVLSYPLVMGSTAYMFLPVFDNLQVKTSYEYLELRFGKSVRLLAAACFTLQMIIYMAIVVYAPALAVEQVTGFNVVIHAFLPVNMAVMSLFLTGSQLRHHLRGLHLLHGGGRHQGRHVDGHLPSHLHVRLLPRHHRQGEHRRRRLLQGVRRQLSVEQGPAVQLRSRHSTEASCS